MSNENRVYLSEDGGVTGESATLICFSGGMAIVQTGPNFQYQAVKPHYVYEKLTGTKKKVYEPQVVCCPVDGGKYTIQFDEGSGILELYRHDELWDYSPKYPKMLISIMYELLELRRQVNDQHR